MKQGWINFWETLKDVTLFILFYGCALGGAIIVIGGVLIAMNEWGNSLVGTYDVICERSGEDIMVEVWSDIGVDSIAEFDENGVWLKYKVEHGEWATMRCDNVKGVELVK